MTRRRSAVVRDDGRLRLRVDLPPEVVELADHLADQAGLDREAVLGDLASVGLPAVLADLATTAVAAPATRRLRSVIPPDAERPRLTTGACSDTITMTAHTVAASLPGDDLDDEDASGAGS